jgi:hypothetical protein
MNQNIWGPHLWFSLHTISFNYPLNPTIQDKEYYKNFFIVFQHVIPCSVCKKNYIRHIKEHPISQNLENRKSLVYWTIDMHNMVNAEIGKKILSYEIVIKKYEEVYKKKIILNNNNILNSEQFKNNNCKTINQFTNNNINNDLNNNINNNQKNYFINIILIIFVILMIINFIKLKKII